MTIANKIYTCLKNDDDKALCSLLGVTDEQGQAGLHANVIGKDGITVYSQLMNHPEIPLLVKLELLEMLLRRFGTNRPQLNSQAARMCLVKAAINLNSADILIILLMKVDGKRLIDINETDENNQTPLDFAIALSLFKPETEISIKTIEQFNGFRYGTLPYAVRIRDAAMIETLLSDAMYETDAGKKALDMARQYSMDKFPAIPLFLSANTQRFSKTKFIDFLFDNLNTFKYPGEVLNYLISNKHCDETVYEKILHILQTQHFIPDKLKAIYTAILPLLTRRNITRYLKAMPKHYHFMFSGAVSSFCLPAAKFLLKILGPSILETYAYDRMCLSSKIDEHYQITINLCDVLKEALLERSYRNAVDDQNMHHDICFAILEKAFRYNLPRKAITHGDYIFMSRNPRIARLIINNFMFSEKAILAAFRNALCISEEMILVIIRSSQVNEIDYILRILKRAINNDYALVIKEYFINPQYEHIYNTPRFLAAIAEGSSKIRSAALTQIVKQGSWSACEIFQSMMNEDMARDTIINFTELTISERYKWLLHLQTQIDLIPKMNTETLCYDVWWRECLKQLPPYLILLLNLLENTRHTIVRAELLGKSVLTSLQTSIDNLNFHPDVVILIKDRGLNAIQMELDKVRQLTSRLKGKIAPLDQDELRKLLNVMVTAHNLACTLTNLSLSSAPAATYFSPAVIDRGESSSTSAALHTQRKAI